MICADYKCIFVHVPKTAGQSIEHFFLNLVGLTWEKRSALLLRSNADPALGPEILAHLTAAEYVSCGYLSENNFADYFKFSFVRNPWERIVSEFLFQEYYKRDSFKDFLFCGLPKPGMSDAYRHIIPQYDYLYNPQGKLLVDFVGRFENLQSDFDEICRRMNLEKSKLPHVNASLPPKDTRNFIQKLLFPKPPKKRYTDYYDSECLAFVTEMYKKDIQAFGYEFGK